MSAQKYVRKGCNPYLAYVLDSTVFKSKLELVPVVYDYPDMCPEELPGLPLIREVEFVTAHFFRVDQNSGLGATKSERVGW